MMESELERYLKKQVEALDGLCIKMESITRGIPDRVVIIGGHTYWIELKREGGKLSEAQKLRISQFKERGVEVFVLRGKEEVYQFCYMLIKNKSWNL